MSHAVERRNSISKLCLTSVRVRAENAWIAASASQVLGSIPVTKVLFCLETVADLSCTIYILDTLDDAS
jgi:hypothetical protein